YARGWLGKFAALSCAVFLIHAILISFSRGGMIALILTGLTAFLLIPRRPIYYVGLALATLVTFLAPGPEVRARFMTAFEASENRDGSAQNRLDYWRYCLDTIPQHPVVGVGPDYWADYMSQHYARTRAEAHNLWLQVTVELGIPALLFLLAYYG